MEHTDEVTDEEGLVKQDVRGRLLASSRAHRLAAYRSPTSVSDCHADTLGTEAQQPEFADATVRRLVNFDDVDTSIYDVYHRSLRDSKGITVSPDLDGLACLRTTDEAGRQWSDWCLATVIFLAVCGFVVVVAILVYFVVVQIDHKGALRGNESTTQASNLEDISRHTTEFEASCLVVNFLKVIMDENEISTNADLFHQVEIGIDRCFESSILKADYKSARTSSFSYHGDGLRVFFILEMLRPMSQLNQSLYMEHMGRAIYEGIQHGEFNPLVINSESIEILHDGQRLVYVHRHNVTDNEDSSSENVGSGEIITTNDDPYNSTMPMNEIEDGRDLVTQEMPWGHCIDLEFLMRTAAHCNSILQLILGAFPSLRDQCSQLYNLESCLSDGMEQCTLEQIHYAVLQTRTWFLSNFRAFDPEMCDRRK